MNACLPILHPSSRRYQLKNGVPIMGVRTGAPIVSNEPLMTSLSQTYTDHSGLTTGLNVPMSSFLTTTTAKAAANAIVVDTMGSRANIDQVGKYSTPNKAKAPNSNSPA